ncbi:MAG: helix-turn-helix transcriptional regulator [Pseudomonadota bacterium]
MIGSLKEDVLLGVVSAGIEKPSAAIYQIVEEARRTHGSGSISFGSVFTTLERLAKDGLVSVKKAKAPSGRTQKLFTITAPGNAALKKAADVRANISARSNGVSGGAHA